MNRTTVILDTNAILRYFLKDNIEQANQVSSLLEKDFKFIVLPEVVVEVIYVMHKLYGKPREEIAKILLNFVSVFANSEILETVLSIFYSTKLDFVDCMLCSYSREYEVFTFDKDLLKYINNKYEA
jgi:predicted nucleic-acid-binding protein